MISQGTDQTLTYYSLNYILCLYSNYSTHINIHIKHQFLEVINNSVVYIGFIYELCQYVN